ncbi:MAG TPA: hypothetical protein VMF89_28345 [Polyangiales bacterium]|nr:hypothetical protein [Polyangiales bacterium]
MSAQQHVRKLGLGLGMACVAAAWSTCAVDTVVYEARSIRNDTRPVAAAGAGGSSDASRVFGCNVAISTADAPAIIQVIVNSASEAREWVRPDRNCSEGRDCRSALLTPACNAETTRCEPCAALPERIAYLGSLGSCLREAIAACCADPEAEQDCAFRKCQSGCGPQ